MVEPGFLEPLVAYGESNEHIGALGPKVLTDKGGIDRNCARRRLTYGDLFFHGGIGRRLFPDNRWMRRHFYYGEYTFNQPKEVEVLSGACMLIKSSVFRKLGLLDENTFLYMEEFILHEKLRTAGLVTTIVPSSRVIHKQGQSTSSYLPEAAFNSSLESLRYYLSHYRGCSQITTALLILANGAHFLKRFRRHLTRNHKTVGRANSVCFF
jgi:GT2 family glycosyltransferase